MEKRATSQFRYKVNKEQGRTNKPKNATIALEITVTNGDEGRVIVCCTTSFYVHTGRETRTTTARVAEIVLLRAIGDPRVATTAENPT